MQESNEFNEQTNNAELHNTIPTPNSEGIFLRYFTYCKCFLQTFLSQPNADYYNFSLLKGI